MKKRFISIVFAAALAFTGCSSQTAANANNTVTLTNVSYDPTRELYEAYNEIFKTHYKETTGNDIQREFDEKRIEKAAKICYNENNDRLRKQKGGFLYGTNSNFLRYRRFLQRL